MSTAINFPDKIAPISFFSLFIFSHSVKILLSRIVAFAALMTFPTTAHFTSDETETSCENAGDNLTEKCRQSYSFAQERVQEGIEHAICHHSESEDEVEHPVSVALFLHTQLVEKKYPRR